MANTLNETWKTINFDFEFTNDFKLEVSNLGKIRTSNMMAKERHLKGSFINNYRAIVLKLYKPRTAKMEKRLLFFKNNLSKLNKKLSPLKQKVKTRVKHDKEYFRVKTEIKELQELYDGLQKIYRKKFKDDLKYRTITLTLLVHRLVAEYFCHKPSDEHKKVIHLDHNRQNNRATNLRWITQKELNVHQQKSPKVRAAKGNNRGKRNEDSKQYKLTSTQVMLLKKKIREGRATSQLCRQFGISKMQVWRIKKGKNWSNVKAAV